MTGSTLGRCWPALAAACLLAACGPCATSETRAPDTGSEDAALDADRLEAWREGRLPASALEGTPRRGGTLTVRAYYEPDTLNPIASGSGITSWIVLHDVAETLVRRDPYAGAEERFLPALAKQWEIDETGTRLTFHLRDGVRWHDGEPFGSKDVAATFEKLRDPRVTAGALKPLYALLEAVETPDERTVVLRWKQPYFLALDTIGRTAIQPAHLLENLDGRSYNEAATNPLNRAPVGTGPFRFVRWDSARSIVLERNDDWWGAGDGGPFVDRVVYRIVPDHTVAQQLAERGELDLWDAVQPHMWIRMTERDGLRRRYHRVRYDSAAYVFIGWNAARPHLSDPAVRRALAMLFNRDALVERIQHGLARPATCHFYFESADCDPDLAPIPHDPEAALAALLEAGWHDTTGDGLLDRDGQPFRLQVMIYPASEVSERVATMMQESYRMAGIEVRIQNVEWSSMVRRLRSGEFDATVLMWSTGPISDPTPHWHSASMTDGANYFAFENAEADALIEAARHELHAPARQEKFRALGRILYEAQPVAFLYNPAHLALVHERVRGVRPSLEWWQVRDMWIVE
jgi:peptide/nickel transport system substrate-binding protein